MFIFINSKTLGRTVHPPSSSISAVLSSPSQFKRGPLDWRSRSYWDLHRSLSLPLLPQPRLSFSHERGRKDQERSEPLVVLSSTLASPTTASPILSRAGGLIRVGYLVSPFSQPCFIPVFIPDLNGSPPFWSLLYAKVGFVNLTGISVFPSQFFDFLMESSVLKLGVLATCRHCFISRGKR